MAMVGEGGGGFHRMVQGGFRSEVNGERRSSFTEVVWPMTVLGPRCRWGLRSVRAGEDPGFGIVSVNLQTSVRRVLDKIYIGRNGGV